MRRFIKFTGALVSFSVAMIAFGQTPNPSADKHSIPLKEIWAYEMPGTKDVAKLKGRNSSKQLQEIREALSAVPPNGKNATHAFAVAGNATDALREAHAILVKGKKPAAKLPADSEVWVVFFSYQFGPFVHISHVARKKNEIEIRYRFVPHESEQVREHLALIPLGRLSSSKYEVDIVNAPMEKEFSEKGFSSVPQSMARRVVSGSFDFDVGEN